ncbi:hypothetical protein K435DRAFT_514876 [Dendrothele bispora CBS 962.96]|uniref:Uncharacterized protein n=1 Tax=Dendrothele bispora (strain CBS 962.96) TaxID=1314807 RepID=A0A4S8M9D9_DENBC|nr:hypothetical protein K435DRAFT_514876 [Dendrothele bispora CBS 962.96]
MGHERWSRFRVLFFTSFPPPFLAVCFVGSYRFRFLWELVRHSSNQESPVYFLVLHKVSSGSFLFFFTFLADLASNCKFPISFFVYYYTPCVSFTIFPLH